MEDDAFKIASMIQFYSRHHYLDSRIQITRKKLNAKVGKVDFIRSNLYEDELSWKKCRVIQNIRDRSCGYIKDNEILLTSEIQNLYHAIADAEEKYNITRPIIYQEIREISKDYEKYNEEQVDYEISLHHERLQDLKNEIDTCKNKLRREMAKREGKLKEYQDELEEEWEEACWNDSINLSRMGY